MNGKKCIPDFQNILDILDKKRPSRATAFEFIIDDEMCYELAQDTNRYQEDSLDYFKMRIQAFLNGGYDFITVPCWFTETLAFPKTDVHQMQSRSQNEGGLISDWESFEKYPWPDPAKGQYEIYDQLARELPDGMKLIACSNGGVLENAMDLVGFENLCIITMTDENLAHEIFSAIGVRLLKYYQIVSSFDSVGAVIGNDDWGFKTQTMFSPEAMRQYVFPWHKKIVEAIHMAGKPAILHSCGNLNEVMHDVIHDIGYDGKHSFEDEIIPVEQAYKDWNQEIAIMGGIDMNMLASASPEEIKNRAENLIKMTSEKGAYALGSGNSVAKYVPIDNFYAMISAIQ